MVGRHLLRTMICDVCVFVLTKSIGISFDVAIFRENETEKSVVLPVHNDATNIMFNTKTCKSNPRRFLKQLIAKGKARALDMASHLRSENPFFTFVMQASYASAKTYRLNLLGHMSTRTKLMYLRLSDGRCWFVQYKVRQSLGRSFIAEFAMAGPKRRNESPSLCSSRHKRIKTRSDHGEARRDSSHFKSKGKLKMMISEENTGGDVTTRPSTSRDTFEAVNKFSSINPYFLVALQSSHFKPIHSRVPVPVAFQGLILGK